MNLKGEEEKINTRLTEAVGELSAMQDDFPSVDTASMIKSEEKVAHSLLSHHLHSPSGIYNNPPYYPVNISCCQFI